MVPFPPNLSAFIRAVEEELQLRGCEFDLSSLIRFCTDVWALARLDPDVPRWAREFIESGRSDVPA